MKMAVFWDVAPFSLADIHRLLEELTASIIGITLRKEIS
jgi:hypothetical protein